MKRERCRYCGEAFVVAADDEKRPIVIRCGKLKRNVGANSFCVDDAQQSGDL